MSSPQLETLSTRETFEEWRRKITEVLVTRSGVTFATDEEFLAGTPNTIPMSGQVVNYLDRFTNNLLEYLLGIGDERLGEIARLIRMYTNYLMARRRSLTYSLIFGSDDD